MRLTFFFFFWMYFGALVYTLFVYVYDSERGYDDNILIVRCFGFCLALEACCLDSRPLRSLKAIDSRVAIVMSRCFLKKWDNYVISNNVID